MGADALPLLRSGAAQLVPDGGLEEKLKLGRPLRIKLGVDPSRPDLTLGHSVVLRKLAQFQEAGHRAVLIIGDLTARIGDPSGRADTRPMLTAEEVDENARTYLAQARLVIDVDDIEMRRNSEWLGGMDMETLIRLASTATVAQMLEREDFRERHLSGRPISIVEFLYPLLQGYDSVAVEADVELGGTDQTFNLLMGREIQRAFGGDPQVVLTMPLLVGTDGVRKMSKSFDNYVGLTEPPDEMFGKLMSIPDDVLVPYLRLCLDLPDREVGEIEAGLSSGSLHPNAEKRRLARGVVDRYHGDGEGRSAEERFDRAHKDREIPEEVPNVSIPKEALRDGRIWIPRLLVESGLASSNGEARRAVEQKGVRLDGELLSDPDVELVLEEIVGKVLQLGRRRFARIEGVGRG